jgi:hypothetical protein
MTEQPTPLPTVYQAMATAMGAVRAVGRWGKNTEQGYAFRSIDHFMSALNPAMSKAGIVVAPIVLQRLEETRQTKGGSRLRCIDLEVRFTFYGPAGDFFPVVTWGEGTDTADKATNKAMVAAFKYAVMQTFMVPTQEISADDGDRTTTEVATAVPAEELDALVARTRSQVLMAVLQTPPGEDRQKALGAAWRPVAAHTDVLRAVVKAPARWVDRHGVRAEIPLRDLFRVASEVPQDETP